MSNILILAFLFFAGCLIGWGIEVIFRRFEPNNKARKWINPGFLIGPYLPLYGFGLCSLYLLAGLEKFIHTDNTALQKFILFLLMAIAMTVIELIAGEIFIVKMHVKLWDYTGNKFNYKGIICPLYSLIWAALGAVYYFFVHPYILDALNWLANNLAFSVLYWIFLWCFCYRPVLFPEAGREDKNVCGRERYGHQIRGVQTAHQGKFRGEKREIQIYAFHGLRCKAWRAFEKVS